MKVPIILLAGFLESGKTTYINTYLKEKKKKNSIRILILSYEEGIQSYKLTKEQASYIKVEQYSSLEQTPVSYFENASYLYDEIIIEYNGTWKINDFMRKHMSKHVYLYRVICMVDVSTFAMYINNIDTMVEHLKNTNVVYLNKQTKAIKVKDIRKCIHQIQPSIALYDFEETKIPTKAYIDRWYDVYRIAFFSILCIVIGTLIFLVNTHRLAFTAIVSTHRIFFSILLQAVPFLLIGIVFSSVLQVYVSDEKFVRFIQKNRILALPILILSGCVLPLCDCAMVPITEKFIQKGISLPLAMIFFCISSSINPIVIASTYYAFPEHPMYIVLRIVLSIVIALCVGLIFFFFGKGQKISCLKTNSIFLQKSYDYDLQQCLARGKMGRFTALGLHISNEFFKILIYVIAGALLSTIVQMFHQSFPSLAILGNEGFILLYMLFASLFLSICASSNAFIAKAFTNTFRIASVFPFMIFGPLLDIKNLLILSSRFTKRFMIIYVGGILVLLLCVSGLLSIFM